MAAREFGGLPGMDVIAAVKAAYVTHASESMGIGTASAPFRNSNISHGSNITVYTSSERMEHEYSYLRDLRIARLPGGHYG